MRKPKRIEPIFQALQSAWDHYPDYRLGQSLVNVAHPGNSCPEPFYLEDDALLERLKSVSLHEWQSGDTK